jgi:hypothetical protein
MLCFCVQGSLPYAAAEARNPLPALRMLGLRLWGGKISICFVVRIAMHCQLIIAARICASCLNIATHLRLKFR